jgi:hypothetical protein
MPSKLRNFSRIERHFYLATPSATVDDGRVFLKPLAPARKNPSPGREGVLRSRRPRREARRLENQMTRTIRLHELSQYFPNCQVSSIQSDTYAPPAHLGRDLENRLITFALGFGALSARIDLSGPAPVLVTTNSTREERRTELTGAARDWHRALNEMDELYNEDELAGLHRFLGIRRQTAEVRILPTRRHTKPPTRCFDQLHRIAA